MKILHVINDLGAGGAEKIVHDMILNQQNNNNVELVLLNDKKNVFQKSLDQRGINIYISPYNNIRDLRHISFLRNIIKSNEYDIVHTHIFPSLYWVSIASFFLKKNTKFIYTEHSSNNKRRNYWVLKPLEKFIYNRYDKIVSISSIAKKNLMNWLADDSGKYSVIENGVDINKFSSATPYMKEELDSRFTDDTILLCMVARFNNIKRHDFVIKSIVRLPDNFHLLFLGKGELENEMKMLAQQLGVAERIHFLGFRDDVERILKTVDIVILASNWEGLSLSSLEGMASGKPFLGTDVEGIREIVSGFGVCVPLDSPEELAKEVKKLIDNSMHYSQTAIKCFNRAENYDIKETVNKYMFLYDSLIDKGIDN